MINDGEIIFLGAILQNENFEISWVCLRSKSCFLTIKERRRSQNWFCPARFLFFFVCFPSRFVIKFRICWQSTVEEKTRKRRLKRFKIISFSRSTYTNIIYLHVVFEITMFVRIVLLGWTVYFINLFMFMNIIPHKNLSKRRREKEKTLRRCRGCREVFSRLLRFLNIIKSWTLATKREEKKGEEKTFWLMSWDRFLNKTLYTSQILIRFHFVSCKFLVFLVN